MADKASDDGSGIWCSKATIALETELSRSTVKRLIKELEAEDLIIATGRRKNAHGYTVEYAINLNAICALPLLKPPQESTEVNVNPAQDELPKKLHVNRQDSSTRTPNHPTTIQEPLSNGERIGSEEVEEYFQLAWMAYPDDRKTKQSKCRKEFFSAVKDGADPEGILRAVQTYEVTSRTYTRSMVKLAHNWFSNRDWIQFIEKEASDLQDFDEAMRASLDRCARWINEGAPQCPLITPKQIKALLDAGRVTGMQLVRVGLEHKVQECGDG